MHSLKHNCIKEYVDDSGVDDDANLVSDDGNDDAIGDDGIVSLKTLPLSVHVIHVISASKLLVKLLSLCSLHHAMLRYVFRPIADMCTNVLRLASIIVTKISQNDLTKNVSTRIVNDIML